MSVEKDGCTRLRLGVCGRFVPELADIQQGGISLLINKHEFDEHQRELLCSGGLAVLVFTSTTYVAPGRTAIYAGASSQE